MAHLFDFDDRGDHRHFTVSRQEYKTEREAIALYKIIYHFRFVILDPREPISFNLKSKFTNRK